LNYNANDPESLPTCVAGVDWRALQKGQIIESRKIVEMFHVIFSTFAGEKLVGNRAAVY
jgi:hypothetical protein